MRPYSVVIPAYDVAHLIGETLASVLAQTVPPAEVVVDDGSSDGTAEVAAAFDPRVRVIRQENAGPGAATNRGVAASGCEIIAFVDADDLWLPRKMELQLAALTWPDGPAAVACRIRQFQTDRGDDGTGEVRDALTRTGVIILREVFDRAGPVIDPKGGRGEFVDWLARVREAGFGIHLLPEVLALRRIRPGSLSYGRDGERDLGYLEVARRALQRRRLREGE